MEETYSNKSYRGLWLDEDSEYEELITMLLTQQDLETNSHLNNNIGLAYFEISNKKEAYVYIKKAIKISPLNFNAHINFTDYLLAYEGIEKVEEHFKQMLISNLDKEQIQFHWALKLGEIKNYSEALKAYKELFNTYPNVQYLKNQAYIYKETKQKELEKQIWKKINSYQKTNA